MEKEKTMGRNSECERVEQIIDNMVSGQESEDKLRFDPLSKILKPSNSNSNTDGDIRIIPEDLIFGGRQNYGKGENNG